MEMDRCRDLRPHYAGYAADAADRSTAMRIQLHLSEGCAACAVEIEQLMEAFHAVPLALRPVGAPAASRDALLEEIGRTPQEHQETPVLFPETDRTRLWKVLAALCVVAVAAVAWWGQGQVDEVERLRGELARTQMMGSVDTRSLERQKEHLGQTLRSVAAPDARIVDLAGDGARARLFLHGGVATLSATPLGAPPEGRLHHVWLTDGDEVALLGRLPPQFSAEGGQVRFAMGPSHDGKSGALITLDPAESTPDEPGDEVLATP